MDRESSDQPDRNMEVPATADSFKMIKALGESAEHVFHQTVAAFDRSLDGFMDAFDRSEVDRDLEWQVIGLSTYLQNLLHALGHSKQEAHPEVKIVKVEGPEDIAKFLKDIRGDEDEDDTE